MDQPNPKPLENHLQRISRRFISIEKDVDTAFRQHFENVSQFLVNQMKIRDKMFAKLFRRLQVAGSYADGIKVNAPNEFDVLVLLIFPNPIPVGSVPGYVTINMREGLNKWLGWLTEMEGNGEKYKRFIDSECYLIQHQVLDWLRVLMREILSDHRNVLQIGEAEYHIEQYNSGPAVTVDVTVEKSSFGGIGVFSIDFVSALPFHTNDKWVGDEQPPLLKAPRYWNTIPKPNKMLQQRNKDWICSYAEIERDLLKGLNTIKPLIRIFKKIRDKANLTNLKSYYIKTIFLHRRLQKSDDYWNKSLAVLFMDMFDVILEHLKAGTLWSLWHKNYNLFSQLDNPQINDIYLKLNRIKETIDKNLVKNNPEIIFEQILTSKEMEDMVEREIVEEKRVESERWCTIL